jgi:hypothetical protein
MPVVIEVFRALASRQRMFGEMQLAERVGFETVVRAVLPRHELGPDAGGSANTRSTSAACGLVSARLIPPALSCLFARRQ